MEDRGFQTPSLAIGTKHDGSHIYLIPSAQGASGRLLIQLSFLVCVEGAWKGCVIPRHQALGQTIRGDPAPRKALTP